MTGQLNIISGPMFSGKTSSLMSRIRRYQLQKKSLLVVGFIEDVRYSKEGISTHYGQIFDAKKVGKLSEIDPRPYEVICIDELHLFPDYSVASDWADQGKVVEVTLINSGLGRSPLEAFAYASARANSIKFISSVCAYCQGQAIYSKRIAPLTDTLIGGAESYTPCCRECY